MTDTTQVEDRIVELSQAVAKAPNNSDVLYELGRALESLGRPEEALTRFESIVRLEPEDHESIHAVGALNLALGNDSAAILSLTKATAIWQEQPEYFADLGEAARKIGDSQGARNTLERARDLALPNEEVSERIRLALDKL